MQGIRAHALIFADAYPEANATPVGFLSSIGEREEHLEATICTGPDWGGLTRCKRSGRRGRKSLLF